MKKVWVRIRNWVEEVAIAAIEGGADALVVPDGCSKLVSRLGKVVTVSKDGNLVPGADVVFFSLKSVEDEIEITKISKDKIVVVKCEDWKIIPLENIIAKGNGENIVLVTENIDDVEIALGVLEKGVGGILIEASDSLNLRGILSEFSYRSYEKTKLKTALVKSIKYVGMGDRVCVDTCTSMSLGQGMLVGNTSFFLFLMHAENIDNPYVEQRPFRINAGAVHAYTRVFGSRTRYLSELSAGDTVIITSYSGITERAIVGRIKIEKRPLLLVEATCDGCTGTTILQNAETIRFISPNGRAKSVVNLEPGNKIVVAVEGEKSGRHFGYKIDEYIDEK